MNRGQETRSFKMSLVVVSFFVVQSQKKKISRSSIIFFLIIVSIKSKFVLHFFNLLIILSCSSHSIELCKKTPVILHKNERHANVSFAEFFSRMYTWLARQILSMIYHCGNDLLCPVDKEFEKERQQPTRKNEVFRLTSFEQDLVKKYG